MELAPVIVFCYNRIEPLKKTIDALKGNKLASDTDLYIYSDAAKNEKSINNVNEVRHYIKNIKGFKNVIIKEAELNKGLALSIIEGVSDIISIRDKVIVLEDDLITSNNFLVYMNQALSFYSDNYKIFSISGYTSPITHKINSDVYFTKRSSSWGWATWKNRWDEVDWEVSDYQTFANNVHLKSSFNAMGSDLSSMLTRQMEGKINSWAIRWCYSQFKLDKFSVFPVISKIENIGFNNDLATHTNDRFSRFDTVLDTSGKSSFHFDPEPKIEPSVLKDFLKPYTILMRIKYKLLNKMYFLYKKVYLS